MQVNTILLVGLDAELRTLTQDAANLVWPAARLLELTDVDAALKMEGEPGGELLALNHRDTMGRTKALKATDKSGLRRWPIVVFGNGPGEDAAEFVPPEDWNARLVARVFRSAATQHTLRRENDRARGEMRTMGHRITHDLRTPLGGIFAAAEALKETLEEDRAAYVPLTGPIFDSANDLLSLINRVGFLARAISAAPPTQRIAVGEVIQSVLERMESRIHARGATVSHPGAWPEVCGVADWLQAIWTDLIANSLKHGGEAPRIKLGWRQEEKKIQFWVKDSGRGVPDEDHNKLFQPFHLLHETNATRGLGLSIVQRLVKLQGGDCGYSHDQDRGAIFYFTLPNYEDTSGGDQRAGRAGTSKG